MFALPFPFHLNLINLLPFHRKNLPPPPPPQQHCNKKPLKPVVLKTTYKPKRPGTISSKWPIFAIAVLLFIIVFKSRSAHSSFTQNATDFPIEDYNVVGGGTAVFPLATILSSRFRVLVLERGGIPHCNFNLMSQDGIHAFDSPVQAFMPVPNTRERVLGGSSAINAGLCSRADNEFYDKALIGFDDRRLVNASYEWIEVFRPVIWKWQSSFRAGIGFELNHVLGTKIRERVMHSAGDLLNYVDMMRIEVVLSEERVLLVRSVAGSVSAIGVVFRDGDYSRADIEFYNKSLIGFDDRRLVNASYEWVEGFRPVVREWQRCFRAGVGGYNCFALNLVLGTKSGGSVFESEGVMHRAADLLSYADRKRTEVVLFAGLERVLLARSVAGSVLAIEAVFRDGDGVYCHAMFKDEREILLAAGPIGTPRLLLLSGVGPWGYLASLGIPVGHHSAYVGLFMYDNPRNEISIVLPVRLDHLLIQMVGITESWTHLEVASNMIMFASPARPGFLRSQSVPAVAATLIEKVVGLVSFGTLMLASTDVRAYPVVRFNYFSDAGHHERCINGTRIMGSVLNSRAMDGFKIHQWFGRRDFRFVALLLDQLNGALMGEFCRRTVTTIWHYHGGCLAGRVVDRDLKVIGVNALRIVDGSTFTVSPGTNPQATVLMMGRYIGMKLLKERMRSNVIC